jgi:hypothetical protein
MNIFIIAGINIITLLISTLLYFGAYLQRHKQQNLVRLILSSILSVQIGVFLNLALFFLSVAIINYFTNLPCKSALGCPGKQLLLPVILLIIILFTNSLLLRSMYKSLTLKALEIEYNRQLRPSLTILSIVNNILLIAIPPIFGFNIL